MKTLIFYILFLSISMTNASTRLESEAGNPNVKLIFDTMDDCYNKQHHNNIDLVKCISHILAPLPNPDNYRVKVYKNRLGAGPSKFDVLIYNKEGFILLCAGMMQTNIQINSCQQYPGKRLSAQALLEFDIASLNFE